jgi:hypothetical protein
MVCRSAGTTWLFAVASARTATRCSVGSEIAGESNAATVRAASGPSGRTRGNLRIGAGTAPPLSTATVHTAIGRGAETIIGDATALRIGCSAQLVAKTAR